MQQVIIYRNQTEAQFDQFLYQDGGAALMFILIVSFVAFIIGAALVDKFYHGRNQSKGYLQLGVGAVFAAVTWWILWI